MVGKESMVHMRISVQISFMLLKSRIAAHIHNPVLNPGTAHP